MAKLKQKLRKPKPAATAQRFSEAQAAGYLAGFVDGEGCIYFRKAILANGKHHQHRVITITNTDPALIAAACACFDILGIEYSRSDRPGQNAGNRHRYIVEIRKGPAMWRFRECVPIQAPEKRSRLDAALESYRGLHCFGCGCLHDEYTHGCRNCRARKYFRDRRPKTKTARR